VNDIQWSRHVTRHREPADLLAWLVVIACVGLAVSPLVAGVVTMLGGGQ